MMLLFILFGCETIGPIATRVIPALEYHEPSWGAPTVDCEEKRTAPLTSGTCFMTTYSCKPGDKIVIDGTTIGGKSKFDDDFFQKAKCTPQRSRYQDSPEAVYKVNVAANTKVVVRLDSSCTDLDPFAVYWNRNSCPTHKHGHAINECEMNDRKGGGSFILTTVNKPQSYLVGVDGKYGSAGNFRMTIQCSIYR